MKNSNETGASMKSPKAKIKSPLTSAKKPKRVSKRDIEMENLKKKKPYVFELTKSYRDSSNPNRRKYPVQYILKGTDIIYDPITNQNRKIRYAPGEKSIFVDEQSENVKVSSIVFKNGTLMVRKTQPHLYEYMMACNANSDNPNRTGTKRGVFRLKDSSKDIVNNMQFAEKQMEAMNLVFNLDEEKLLAHAMVMGININRGLQEIKYDLKIMAEKDPAKFIEEFNDPKAEKKYHILLAEDYDIIGHDHYEYFWKRAGQKQTIVNIPIGKNPIDYFVNFLYEKDGEVVYSQILKELEE